MKKYIKQDRIHSLRKIMNPHSKRFHWNLITMCNYHCEYCYSRAADFQWNKITSGTVINEVIEKLKQIKDAKEIFLLGGEPTLHPKYFEVLDELYKLDNLDVLGNISNGSYKDYKTMIDKHEKYKDKFYWNITFHPSQVDVESFCETILYVKQKDFLLNVNILLYEKYKNEINLVFKFCRDNDIIFYPSFLFEGNEFMEFNDIEWLKEINEKYYPNKELYYHTENGVENYNDLDTYMKNLNSFKGWKCVNNSFVIPVRESRFMQFCTNKEFDIETINKESCIIDCPLQTCVCPARMVDEKFRTTSE